MSKFTKALEKMQDARQQVFAPGKIRVPSSTEDLGKQQPSRGAWDRGIKTVRNATPEHHIVMLRFPDSMPAEQYRMLRTSLKTELARRHGNSITVSSSIHSEGKSVTATNLAASLAENGEAKVCLVDADLRRGKIADYLGLGKNLKGLSTLLQQSMNPKEVMVRGPYSNLTVIPRGPIVKKPAELVVSNRFGLLMTELKAMFDYVIVDAPPIMAVADASILARETDGVLFVIQTERTPKSVVAQAHVLFKQSDVDLIGYALTNVEYQSSDYRYYYYNYGEESEKKKGVKEKVQFQVSKAGHRFRNVEDSFNRWWYEKVLGKKKHKKKLSQRKVEQTT